MTSHRNIAIFRDHLLPPSETFVRAQGENMKDFVPHYVGSRKVKGLSLPQERTFVLNKRGGYFGKGSEALFKLVGYAPPLFHYLSSINTVLIHAHFGVDGSLALPLAKSLDIPLIVTYHGFDVTMKDAFARRSYPSHRLYLHRRERLRLEGSMFIAVSNFIREQLLAQGFDHKKIHVHYIGIDLELFSFRHERRSREPTVLFVGRLTEKKGGEYLIRAMKLVQRHNPNMRLVVIGDGPLRQNLETLAKENIENYEFLGFQSPDVVRDWLRRVSLFCVPSVIASSGDAEAFGMVFAEAQAMGTPVASFASGGIPEVVIHGVTGLLANEKDYKELATNIIRITDDNELWSRLSQQGQEHVRKSFDIRLQTRKLEEIYERVLNEQGTSKR